MTLEQLDIELNRITQCPDIDSRLLVSPLEFARGSMLFRIHNEALDVDNTPIGEPKAAKPPHVGVYGQSHGRRRARRGRQVNKKDLEFEGGLRRSLVTGTTDGLPSLGFSNDQSRIIAEGQQEQTGKTIWGLSQREEAEFLSQLDSVLNNHLNDCL